MLCIILTRYFQGGYGATVARLTPDQKVGSSNLSALMFPLSGMCKPCEHAIPEVGLEPTISSLGGRRLIH